MSLLDPVDDNPTLAVVVLGCYLVAAGLSVTTVGESADLPSPLFFGATAGPLSLYAGYHVIRGSTFNVWPTVTYGVVVLSFLAVVPASGAGRFVSDYRPEGPVFLAVMGAPLVVFGLYVGGRRVADERGRNG